MLQLLFDHVWDESIQFVPQGEGELDHHFISSLIGLMEMRRGRNQNQTWKVMVSAKDEMMRAVEVQQSGHYHH